MGMDVSNFAKIVGVAVVAAGACLLLWSQSKKPQPTSKQALSDEGKDGATKKGRKKSFLEELSAIEDSNIFILFYGSQTGTAEDLATRVAKEATTEYGIHCIVCDLEEYEIEEFSQLPSKNDLDAQGKKWLVGFFMATYGEGEPTDNAVKFYEWVLEGRGKGEDEGIDDDDDATTVYDAKLKNMNYIMFGLGNMTYEHFNAVARRLDKKFEYWGATRIGERGEGDDDGSLEEDFLNWKPNAFKAIEEFFNVTSRGGNAAKRDEPHIPLFEMTEYGAAKVESVTSGIDAMQIYWGELTATTNRRWCPAPSINGNANGTAEIHDGEASNGIAKEPIKYIEVKPKRAVYDIKHPYYGLIINGRPLYKEVDDVFAFDSSSHKMPESCNSAHVTLKDGGDVVVKRQCYHLEFDIEGSGIKYETGDHIGLFPANSDEEITKLAKALEIKDLDIVFSLKTNLANSTANMAKSPFPLPCTLRAALKYYLDLRTPVKQFHLEILGKFAANETEKAALFEYADSRDKYNTYIDRSQKTLAEILSDFPSVKPPLPVVLAELLTRTSVKYYSISSSRKKSPTKVAITAVIVRYALASSSASQPDSTPSVVIKEGQATSWLQRIQETGITATEQTILPPLHVPLYIRTSTFRLPQDSRLPVIMVGPGTGVAPFRGFVQDRYVDVVEHNKDVGPTWLFYGCRHPEKDYLYRDEFEAIEKSRKLNFKLITAFSRVKGQPKVYVQNRMAEHKKDLWEMLHGKRGYIYVCGDAKNMAADVNKMLATIAVECGSMVHAAAEKWVKDLKSAKRYQEDVWS